METSGPLRGARYASASDRWAAILIDDIVFRGLLVVALFVGLAGEWYLEMGIAILVIIVAAIANEFVGVALWGCSIGRMIRGIRVVDVSTGRPPGWRRTLARAAAETGIGATPLWPFMYLGVLTRRDRRAWHDRIAGTAVIRSPRRR